MKKIIVTTTESLQGWNIVEYLKPINASAVVGAGFMSDVSASFTDFFGGRSTKYENNLTKLNSKVVDMLKANALEIGANCIVGLKVDVDEISGKNMQMFMVTAWGTAVIAQKAGEAINGATDKQIDASKLNDAARLKRLARKHADPNSKILSEDLEFIIDAKAEEFKEYLFGKFKALSAESSFDTDNKKVLDLYTSYLIQTDPKTTIPLLYNELMQYNKAIVNKILEVIKAGQLVNYQHISKLLNGPFFQRKIALEILRYDKQYYTHDDIVEMQGLMDTVSNAFPETVAYTKSKGLFSSSEKDVWTCQCGKSNDLADQYCYIAILINEVSQLTMLNLNISVSCSTISCRHLRCSCNYNFQVVLSIKGVLCLYPFQAKGKPAVKGLT